MTDDGHRWPVSTLALSADGKSLYTYAHGDPVRVWDWATGKETGQFRAPDRDPCGFLERRPDWLRD